MPRLPDMASSNDDIIRIEGPEQATVETVPVLPDAGLPPAIGVHSYQVFRASKAEKPDEYGWTYHHHVDIACWRGRLYVGWNTCEIHEDVWPSRELYSTSVDGKTWESPRELFPQGISTPLRIYFYLAKNGRMLAIAGLRANESDTNEEDKGALVVREIKPDHSLGPVYILQAPADHPTLPRYIAGDAGLGAACDELLANRVYLEQQDLGRLLGDRAMPWHRPERWPAGSVPGDSPKWVAGKAYSFFTRKDGLRVGISKMGWTTTTTDEGLNWTRPLVPPTLVTDKAKVWSQRTKDGRWALVYNPTKRTRYPLIVVTSDDGITFSGMRIVQGELPVQRYPGQHRSIGPQYIRGISEWSDDRSRPDDKAMWLVYSMSKEDIWVSRVPLPVETEETGAVATDLSRWTVYQPKWSSVLQRGESIELIDRDPHDYASVTRCFPRAGRASITMDIAHSGRPCSIDLISHDGSKRAVQIRTGDDPLFTGDIIVRIDADAASQTFSLSINGTKKLENQPFLEPAADLHRITFRTGDYRGIGGATHIDPQTDRPIEPTTLLIRSLRVE